MALRDHGPHVAPIVFLGASGAYVTRRATHDQTVK